MGFKQLHNFLFVEHSICCLKQKGMSQMWQNHKTWRKSKKIRILIYVNKLLQFILRIHDEDITTIGARISGLHSHTGRIIRKRGWRLWCANIQFKLEGERIRNASSSEFRSNKTWTLRPSENSWGGRELRLCFFSWRHRYSSRANASIIA